MAASPDETDAYVKSRNSMLARRSYDMFDADHLPQYSFRSTLRLELKAPPDFKIKIDGYEWQVHSRIMSRESEFFEAVCNGKFKESDETSVTLHEDCPWIIARMIRWIYTRGFEDYDAMSYGSPTITMDDLMYQGSDRPNFAEAQATDKDRPKWQVLVMLYKVADKYSIPPLAVAVQQRLSILFTNSDSDQAESMFKDILRFLETSNLLSDESLSKVLLIAAFRKVGDVAKLNNEMVVFYRSHQDFLQFTCSTLAHLLKQSLEDKQLLRDTIQEIREEVDEYGTCVACAEDWSELTDSIEEIASSALSLIDNQWTNADL